MTEATVVIEDENDAENPDSKKTISSKRCHVRFEGSIQDAPEKKLKIKGEKVGKEKKKKLKERREGFRKSPRLKEKSKKSFLHRKPKETKINALLKGEQIIKEVKIWKD